MDLFGGVEFGDEGFGGVGVFEDQDEVGAELAFELGDSGGFGDGEDSKVLRDVDAEFGGNVGDSIVIEIHDIEDDCIGVRVELFIEDFS